tara:strand:- start:178 stop:450 length:273 start_codon:yes stop_codon:yes gene_type:complete
MVTKQFHLNYVYQALVLFNAILLKNCFGSFKILRVILQGFIMLLLDFLEIFISIDDTLVNFFSVAHVVFSSEHHELDEVNEGNYNVDPVG